MSKSVNLCSAAELQRLLETGAASVLDCSWYLPSQQIDSRQAYRQQHIPGASFFDIDEVCDQDSDLPHMLPSAAAFARAVCELGIDRDSEVVVYDTAGIFSAARVWWMFRVFGHSRVRVLDGGLPAWVGFGGTLCSLKSEVVLATANTAQFIANFIPEMVTSKAELLANCATGHLRVLDARSAGRFAGLAPEPRPGLPSGHMPHSMSVPFDSLLDAGRLKSANALRTLFLELGVSAETRVVTSCGSGVTAAIITLALAEAGFGTHRLYDGAWAEWGASEDTAILTGSDG